MIQDKWHDEYPEKGYNQYLCIKEMQYTDLDRFIDYIIY